MRRVNRYLRRVGSYSLISFVEMSRRIHESAIGLKSVIGSVV
jgi:hypothetical protein